MCALLHKYPPSAHKHDKAVLSESLEPGCAAPQSRLWSLTVPFTSWGILRKLLNLTLGFLSCKLDVNSKINSNLTGD